MGEEKRFCFIQIFSKQKIGVLKKTSFQLGSIAEVTFYPFFWIRVLSTVWVAIAIISDHCAGNFNCQKISGVPRFEPGSAGWEAQTLLLCYAVPQFFTQIFVAATFCLKIFKKTSDVRWRPFWEAADSFWKLFPEKRTQIIFVSTSRVSEVIQNLSKLHRSPGPRRCLWVIIYNYGDSNNTAVTLDQKWRTCCDEDYKTGFIILP